MPEGMSGYEPMNERGPAKAGLLRFWLATVAQAAHFCSIRVGTAAPGCPSGPLAARSSLPRKRAWLTPGRGGEDARGPIEMFRARPGASECGTFRRTGLRTVNGRVAAVRAR